MFSTSSGIVDKFILPQWINMKGEESLQRILDGAGADRGASYGSVDPDLVTFR